MIQLYVDADACPVKEEVYRVARRHGLTVHVVANKVLSVPRDPLLKPVVVPGGLDEADDWIAQRATPEDITITADIPLASRCLKAGARVLDPRGRAFTEDSIGDALAGREVAAFMRDLGLPTSGPKPYTPQDRSRFLNALENQIQALLKQQRLRKDVP